MGLKLKNTLSGIKEDFRPLKDGEVSIYVCGVTLYDDIHVGHLKSIVAFEVMRNYFEKTGSKVVFVRNITDVDDKIIAKAEALNIDPLILVNTYVEKFHNLLETIGIRAPTVEPRVTQYLSEIESYIQDLKNSGHAYQAEDGIYFDTQLNAPERYPLSKKIVKDLENNTRLGDENHNKRHKADFALWKLDNKHGYHSNIFKSQGRPGWHIECSVMHHHTLGEKFDIHGGGRDLIFPHHENEILQSVAHNGVNPSNYWVHNGMMTKDGKKLSKSLGNSIYVKDMLLKYSAEAIKIFLNKGQYNQSQEFQEDEIKEAHQRWNNFVENIPNYNNDVLNESDIVNNVVKALEDDFNTPLAITILYASLKELNTNKSARLADEILIVLKLLSIVPNVTNLGLIYDKWKNNQEMPEEIRILLEKRIEAKSNKDFKLSDNLRDIILEKGWSLKDTVNGFEIQKIIQ